MTNTRCPCCKEALLMPEVAYNNVENCGDNTFIFKHSKCGNKISVHLKKVI